jgi:crotonobetaine/carnitine-CoA ligase
MTQDTRSISVPALLAQRAESDPQGIFIQEVGGPTYHYAEFHRSVLEVADALATVGVGPGNTVAVMLEPSVLAHVCWIGIAWLKALEVPVNPEF